jgi:hypothetical protein
MFTVAEQNSIGLNSVNRHVIRAWLHSDEPDNAQPIGPGLYGTCIPATEVVRRSAEMKAHDPTRPIFIGFGQGIANEFWKGRGRCNGDLKYYDIAAEGADILSFDIYPVGSKIPQVKGKLEYVARGVTKLMKLAMPGQTVWNTIEASALDPERPATPAEVRSEAWMSLIHGSTGIIYFVHEFTPRLREDAIFGHPKVVEEVTQTNQLIRALAPVLNSPSVIGKPSAVPIATMMKSYENVLYVFAVAMQNQVCSPRFTISQFRDGLVQVLGEDRSLNISNGSFEDSFVGYGVHIYRISNKV